MRKKKKFSLITDLEKKTKTEFLKELVRKGVGKRGRERRYLS
jgi:hypothetical protein